MPANPETTKLPDGMVPRDRNGNPPLYGRGVIDRSVIQGECEDVTAKTLTTKEYLPDTDWKLCKTCDGIGRIQVGVKILPCPDPHCSCGLIVSKDAENART